MPLSKQVLQHYVRETGGGELSDEAMARLTTAAATAASALEALAPDSLFDTEPAQLPITLDDLAGGKDG